MSETIRVLRNAHLATFAAGTQGMGIVEHGAVAIEGGRILYAGPEQGLPNLPGLTGLSSKPNLPGLGLPPGKKK